MLTMSLQRYESLVCRVWPSRSAKKLLITSFATGLTPSRVLAAWCLAVAVVFGLAAHVNAFRHSHFFGDDLYAFALANTLPAWNYIFTPIDVHPVPLHRLVNLLVSQLAPMNYAVAQAFLASLQVATLCFLYLGLRRLKKTPANAVFVCWYGTFVLYGTMVMNWSSSLHRLPFICATAAAFWFYARYRDSGGLGDAAVVVAAMVLGLGFYEKSMLIPFALMGVELSLIGQTTRQQLRANIRLLVVLGGLMCIYFIVWRSVVADELRSIVTDVPFLANYIWIGLGRLGMGGAGHPPPPGSLDAAAPAWILTAWLLFFIISVGRSKRSALTWVVGTLVVSIWIVVTALSPSRSEAFGLGLALVPRYYPDVMLVTALFAAIAWQAGHWQMGWPHAGIGVALIGLFAVSSAQSATVYQKETHSFTYEARNYLNRFVSSARAIRNTGAPLNIRDDRSPKYLETFVNHKFLVTATGVDAVVVSVPSQAQFFVRHDGEIVPLSRPSSTMSSRR